MPQHPARPRTSVLPTAALLATLAVVLLPAAAIAGPWPQLQPRDVPLAQLLDTERSVPGSLSLGGPSGGRLAGAVTLQGDHLELLPGYAGRDTAWATREARRVLRDGARAMAACGQPVLRVGNASVQQGGPMRWSRSHQNGRDVDLAFPMRDAQGSPVLPDRLATIRPDGVWTANASYRIDAEATWCLVHAVMTAAGEDVQWIFVSRPLRQKILREGLRRGVPEDEVRRVGEVLQQPSDALPHDDHLHLRLACAPANAREGCWSWGPRWEDALDTDRLVRRRLQTLQDDDAGAALAHPLADALAHGSHWRWWVRSTLQEGDESALERVWAVAERRQHLGDASAVLEAAWQLESPLLPVLLGALDAWRDVEADTWLQDRLRAGGLEALAAHGSAAAWIRRAHRRPVPGLIPDATRLAHNEGIPEAIDWLSAWLGEPFAPDDPSQAAWLAEMAAWQEDQPADRLAWALERWCAPRPQLDACLAITSPEGALNLDDPRWAIALLRELPNPLLLLLDRWLVDATLGGTPRHGWDRNRLVRYWTRRADARAWGEPDLPARSAEAAADDRLDNPR